jgi:dUTPase
MLEIPNFKFALREDLKDRKEFLPTKAEPYATGYDVRAALYSDEPTLIINPGDYFKIRLGFRAIPENGWWFQLHPRSSSFAKKNMHNLIGIIDEHYSDEVLFAGQYLPTDMIDSQLKISQGDAIGQIIPIKRVDFQVTEISNKEYDDLCKQRISFRNGGFGSTS